ncbi:MAG: hypothetical protein ABSA46_18780 [Thermodesulfovibrionales bacterium]
MPLIEKLVSYVSSGEPCFIVSAYFYSSEFVGLAAISIEDTKKAASLVFGEGEKDPRCTAFNASPGRKRSIS